MRIIVVEDDDLIVGRLVKILNDQHYTVDFATDGEAAWELMDCFSYDLILLDVMLPKLDGISLCRRLRSIGNKTPILLLTAQDNSTTKVMGLDAGADDYLAKPFDFQELLARIRALLRRGGSTLPPMLVWQNLQLDPSTCQVMSDGQLLHLTPKEYSLLELFLRNTQRVFSCGMLIQHLWSFEEPPSDDTVRSHIKGLRQKLKAAGVKSDVIETVYGIGYRLKTVEKEELTKAGTRKHKEVEKQKNPKLATQTPSYAEQSQIRTGVSQVWEQVAETLSQRITVIEEALTTLLQNKLLGDEVLLNVKQEAHKLVGSLGMFGSDKGSYVASKIESLFADGKTLDAPQIIHFSELVGTLRDCLQSMNGEQIPEMFSNETLNKSPLLLIVDEDAEFTSSLIAIASSWGINVQVTPDVITAKKLIVDMCPDIVLLDLSCGDTAEKALGLLVELTSRTPPLSVIVTTAQDSLIDRVKIARLGGRGVLQKPMSVTQVLEAVTQVLKNTPSPEAKVMVVDDDPQILTALQTLLTPWGLKVYTLDNPSHFWEVMTVVNPDLLILDVEMPEINGIELCQVVRSDTRYSAVPILFLTAHNDTKTRQDVFAAGADDYIIKPIVKVELVTRILNRLERTRLLKSLAETDVLTGIANRPKSIQELNRCIEWSTNYNQQFCFAIVEVDKFKQINQQYGYAVGDAVLSRLGRILRLNFHYEDVVGRWGGTEFIIGMCGMTKVEGTRRLSEVIKNLATSCRDVTCNVSCNKQFCVNFNVGIVQYPEDGADIDTLYRVANEALEQSKAVAQNRLLNN
ncbi:transcriptional regulator [Dulcicalothrix desertica PCC 7102]|uniref:Transcriptional regulator n=1 Tax=Dulcicalothrix desertica PCC 7102 TaxID=232991 RepID=A0A3S1AM16_9CYAN|nr:response regulator [Dulcicalothrix desertica]RUT04313.1 transcriptional regulator [Dulcicalothrix desertica PCC 7102]TWH51171.1 diguanylate cyclase (GGDEF)-like protein [Dulcicalothrix desertica PCC 7102]